MANDFIALPRSTGAPSTQTFNGLEGGMNLAEPPYKLGDNQGRYMQDILLDQPGYIRRRGPIVNTEGLATLSGKAAGIATTYDALGNVRVAAWRNGFVDLLASPFTSVSASEAYRAFSTAPYPIFDSKSALLGGAWIGTTPAYTNVANNANDLQLWRGAINSDYSTGTVTVARGSTSVTGAGTTWNAANVSTGMFLFANTDTGETACFIGVVAAFTSTTALTLEKPALHAATAKSYFLTPFMRFQPRATTGLMTATTSNPTVTGANTKFASQVGAFGGPFDVYRMRDDAFVGRISSITNNTSLQLTTSAAVAMNNEEYYIMFAQPNGSTNWPYFPGQFNSTYASRQWYANNPTSRATSSRVWFSETTGPMDVDFSAADGNFIDIASTGQGHGPIMGIAASYNALLVFKESETFGIFGDTPATFNVQKIQDDGTLANGSIQTYNGGVVWAGRTGIYYYDGVKAENIVKDSLGSWYSKLVSGLDLTTYRMWSAIARNHYILYIEHGNSTVPIRKGSASTTPTYFTIAINLDTMAVTTFTNLALRGSVAMPGTTGLETLLLFNTASAGQLVSSKHIFDDTGTDAYVSDVASTTGPDFYIETKKHDGGDSLLLKLWTQLVLDYKLAGQNIILANSPQLYWKFNEPAGASAIIDYSGNNHTGTPLSLVKTGQPGNGTGVLSTLIPADLTFGGNSRISTTYQPFVAGASRTFMGWTMVPGVSYSNVPEFFGAWNSDALSLWIQPNGADIRWTANDGGSDWVAWVGAWPGSNQWVHWAVTYNDTTKTAELFINGISKGTRTVINGWTLHSAETYGVGNYDGIGYVEHYAVFNSILPSATIQAIAATTLPDPALNVDTIVGLNDTGNTITSSFPPNSSFIAKRARFLTRSQNFAFRVWQANNGITDVTLGPYQLSFRNMRPGRV